MKPLSDTHSVKLSGISTPVLAGIFCASASTLVYQIGLTRLFSIIMWHHHAYLVVSVALLGFGAAGAYVASKSASKNPTLLPPQSLLQNAVAYALTLPASYFLATRIQIHVMNLLGDGRNFCIFLMLLGLLAVPFFFAGLIIAACFQAYSKQAGQLYAFDLLGAAAGALTAPFLLNLIGVNGTAMAAALFAGMAALCFSFQQTKNRLLSGVMAGLFLFATVGFGVGFLFWEIPMDISKQNLTINYQESPRLKKVYSLEIPYFQDKHLVWVQSVPDMTQHQIMHSAIAQLDIWPEHSMHMLGGGEFGLVDAQVVPMRMVTQDGIGPTFLYKNAGRLENFPSLDDSQFSSAYLALKTSGKTKPKVLVIGVGGGIDVMTALFHDALSVTAVEINQAMIRMVTKNYADYIGYLFSNPGITLIREDGRSFLNRTNSQYDVIQLTGVDTLTALSTGAYTLSENYLYTVEAVHSMVGHLSPDGIICYSRPIFSLFDPPRETLRLAITARAALEKAGMETPWRHIAVLQGKDWASTMIKKAPFTREECQALADWAAREGFAGLVFNPYSSPQDEKRGEDSFSQSRSLFSRALRVDKSELNHLIQKSAFNLFPPTDDKPFFFNYYRMSNVTSWWGRGAKGEMRTQFLPEFPAGHMILTAAVLQVSILACLFILVPVWAWNRQNAVPFPRVRTFVYFASLGLGFMFIEICLMQKLVLFLGHPTYAISVVLAGMLAFAGAGSFVSSRLSIWTRKRLIAAGFGVAALCLLNVFLLNAILSWITGLPWVLRITAVLVLIAPTGVLLGIFFPLGIRHLAEQSPKAVPWAWAINGFFTVLGSVLAIMVAMSLGFSWVLFLAGIIYLAGSVFGLAIEPKTHNANG